MRYGIIGTGGHGFDGHASHGEKIAGMDLVSIFDTEQAAMTSFADKLTRSKPTQYQDLTKFFQSDTEAVIICSLDEFHLEQLRLALAAGKHTLVEKPVAMNRQEMDEFVEIAKVFRQKGLVLTSCHPRRFDPPYVYLKKMIPEWIQKYGAAQICNLGFEYHRPSAVWKLGRSLMMDHFNHELDMLRFLFGDCIVSGQLLKDGPLEYEFYGSIQLPSNRQIYTVCKGSRYLEAREFHETVDLQFERASVHLDTFAGTVSVSPDEGEKFVEVGLKTNYEVRSSGIMLDFYNAVCGNTPSYLTHEDIIANNSAPIQLLENGVL